jgi:glucosamine 6-phosphate synthetase-like amidotransferase/phosphosugar isomerase protein
MCGIVGAITKTTNGFNKNVEDAFWQLLFADTVRGDDSTGVIFIENDSSFGIMKEAYPAPWCINNLMNSKQGKSIFNHGKALIGHNRKKTSGAVCDENAHPFVVNDTFAMVHNGTLFQHTKLADTVVDSEALTIHLQKVLDSHWDKEKFEEEIGKVDGAYAIAAYNQDTHTVYLARNAQRPLAFCETPEGFFWASETMMLAWILSRNNIDFKNGWPQQIKENSLYKINLDTNKVTIEEYVPKKAQATQIVAGNKGKSVFTTPMVSGIKRHSPQANKLSKTSFKHIRKGWINAQIRFWCDDFVEKHFPKTIPMGETEVLIMGESDSFSFDHIINGEFDLNALSSDSLSITDTMYIGKVNEMVYDKRTGMVTITVDNVEQIPESITPTKHIIDDEYIRAKLEEEVVTTLYTFH